MHPDRAFAWEDEAALRAFVAARSFAQICTIVDGRLGSAQAPLSVAEDGTIAFHLARRNALTEAIAGFTIEAPVLRGIAKLGQNKRAAEAAGAIAALRAIGRDAIAREMEQAR